MALVFFALAGPQVVAAQAWLPEQGSFGASFIYSDVLNLHHYSSKGDEVDAGHTRSATMGMNFAYSPTDKLMLTAGIPYVTTRYWGDFPHPGEIDDGHDRSTWTDLRISAHYQALLEPFALAPYIAYVAPVTDYETMGHSAPGRGLTETWLGFWTGKSLSDWIPNTYVQGRYNYAFVEEVANVSNNHSNLDFEVGHFLNRQWAVRAMCFMRFAHGGIDLPIPRSSPLFVHHDQLGASTFTNVGLGGSYMASRALSFYAMYLTSLRGTNGHKLDQGVTFGMSYGFTPLRERVEKTLP